MSGETPMCLGNISGGHFALAKVVSPDILAGGSISGLLIRLLIGDEKTRLILKSR
uniref:Aquaporin-8 n=1 Tax=Mus musculus TaxID=10090 RepID=O88669_MOUSE|nr:aquaporin-8 [Mus musculus]